MSTPTLDAATVRLLLEAGYVAAGRTMTREAYIIFLGARAARPDEVAPIVGLATTRLSVGDHQGAAKILREGVEAHPDDAALKSFLGLALRLGGSRGESETLLQEIIAKAHDQNAVQLARNVLASA